jgi:Flp pilus assembly protein TadB
MRGSSAGPSAALREKWYRQQPPAARARLSVVVRSESVGSRCSGYVAGVGGYYWDDKSRKRRRSDGGSLAAAWIGFALFALALSIAVVAVTATGTLTVLVGGVILVCLVAGVVVFRQALERPPTRTELAATLRRALRNPYS